MQDTMMMGADYYQTDSEIATLLAEGKVPVGVGENTKIRYHDNETFHTHMEQNGPSYTHNYISQVVTSVRKTI